MSDTFMEHLPTPRESYQAQPILELVPQPPEIDYFNLALNHPVPKSETLLSTEEIVDIRRERAEDVTPHFLTTLILRLAGDETDIMAYREYHAIRETNENLQRQQTATKKKLEATQKHLEEITEIADPYLEVYGKVLRYAEVVKQVREGRGPEGMRPSQFFGEIYDRTEHMEHPALKFIRSRQQELRESSIEAERLFRLMLINPDL